VSRKQDAAFPTRTCVGCGRRDRQSAMLRLKHAGQGRVVTASAVREGRSAYVHAAGECVRGLARSKALQKSLRQTIAKEARLALIASLETELAAGPKAAAERDGKD
jgi:predicted RNA-binding protein YlxR (DUF448 family)